MSAVVVGIDPGLAHVGVAVFDLARWDGSSRMEAQALALVHAETLRSAANAPLADRLLDLHRPLDALLRAHRPRAAFVERTYAGLHHHSRERQRSRFGHVNSEDMRGFFSAYGVCLLTAAQVVGSPHVNQLNVPPWPKAARHQTLEVTFRRAGVPLPRGKDLRDAVWIGLAGDWAPYRRTGLRVDGERQ
jgi:hypothetical protein